MFKVIYNIYLEVESTMSINIKNSEVVALAKRVANLTGENITQTILTALKQRLNELKSNYKNAPAENLQDIINACKALPDVNKQSPNFIADDLYDDAGLPK